VKAQERHRSNSFVLDKGLEIPNILVVTMMLNEVTQPSERSGCDIERNAARDPHER
jgi:hypothetical protein